MDDRESSEVYYFVLDEAHIDGNCLCGRNRPSLRRMVENKYYYENTVGQTLLNTAHSNYLKSYKRFREFTK